MALTASQKLVLDLQRFSAGAIAEMYVLDLSGIGGPVTPYRFHCGTNEIRTALVWQGNSYQAMPIKAAGFEKSGKGQSPRPKLRVANATSIVSALCREYKDMVGAKITRKRTMVRYLDAVNFLPARNMLVWTEQMNNGGSWPTASMTVNYDQTVAPDGRTTAEKAIPANGATMAWVQQNVTFVAGKDYTLSIHAKAAELTAIRINLYALGTGDQYGILNLSTGAWASSSSLATLHTPENKGNGWWRGAVTFTAPTDLTNANVQPARLASGTGNGASGFYIWGAQLEQASAPTDYQPITDVYQRNPSADPNAYFPDDVFWVERKTAENKQFVEFELSPIWDVSGIMLPRRQYIQNVCSWRYRSAECSYAGGPVATKNDQATSDPVLDVCGKRLASCKLRFGDTAQLPFGGFPGVGLVT